MRLQFDVNGKVIIPEEYRKTEEKPLAKRKRSVSSEASDRSTKRKKVEVKLNGSYDKEYIVEKILAHKVKDGQNMFLVKWKGWSEESNTWEPLSHLENCPMLLADFLTDVLSQNALNTLKERFHLSHELTDRELEQFIPKKGFSALPDKLKLQRQLINILATPGKERDAVTLERAKNSFIMYLLHLRREVQLNNLREWEAMMTKECKEDALIKVENDYDLEGPPKGFIYINECLASSDITIPDDPLVGCECDSCQPKNRKCCGVQNAHFRFNYSQTGRMNLELGTPVYECNKRCKCGPDCRNRVMQKGRKAPLCIYRTNNGCGWGVRALRKIYKGEFVCEYVGEIITQEEAEKRGKNYDRVGRTYLFDLDFNSADNPYTIDAATYGNISHFINHSCEPNLAVWAVWVDCLDPNIPKLALYALREIEKNEQLTFDYGSSNGGSNPNTPEKKNRMETSSDEKAAPNGVKRSMCKCNANSCRRYLF